MKKAKFIFFAVVIVVFLMPTSTSAQEIKESNAFEVSPGYFMFGRHSEGEIYGTDRSIEYTTMQDMVERYTKPDKWINKVVRNTSEIIIAVESDICSDCGLSYKRNSSPRYVSVYYTDEHNRFRRLRVHFGKGSYERSFGRYKILISAKTSSVYEGETLVYKMKTPSNA